MKKGITFYFKFEEFEEKPCPKFFKKKRPQTFKKKIRESDKCHEWTRAVFERDNYTCQICKHDDRFLNAHHIKPFAQILKEHNITTYEEAMKCTELWDISNGITLCEKCHRKKHRGE